MNQKALDFKNYLGMEYLQVYVPINYFLEFLIICIYLLILLEH